MVSQAGGFEPLFPIGRNAARHAALPICRSLDHGCRSGPRDLGTVGSIMSILRCCVFSVHSLTRIKASRRVFRGGGRTTLEMVSITSSVQSGDTLCVSCLTVVTRGDIVIKS